MGSSRSWDDFQPTTSKEMGTKFYNHIELNLSENLSEVGSGCIPGDNRKECSPAYTSISALRESKQRNQSSVPGF